MPTAIENGKATIENGKASEKRFGSAADAFIPTKEYHRFAEFCEACRRERYIGLCYGPAGVGKTLSAHRYAKQHLFKGHLGDHLRQYRRAGSEREIPAEVADCYAVLYTPSVTNTPRSVENGLYEARLVLNQYGGACRAG